MSISDTVTRKFIEVNETDEWEVLSHDGWRNIESSNLTVEYLKYIVRLENGLVIECADDHILIDANFQEVFAKDCLGRILYTENGPSMVISVENTGVYENMYDLSVDGDHLYYTNGILSHNTTIVAAVLLWYAIFTPQYRIAVLANKSEQSQEILARIKMMYEFVPWWMQVGVTRWNELSVGFGNRSAIVGASTGGTSIRGRSFSLVYMDEFAWIDNDLAFYTSTYPTITSGKKTKIVITSTPHGMNLFYKIWDDAIKKKNNYVPMKVHWSEYPGKDEAWAQEQIKNTSQRQFDQEFNVEFLGSSDTLISPNALQKLTYSDPQFLLGDNKDFKIYSEPQDGRSYVATVDVSEGVGLDYSVINVTDVTEVPYRQVAMMRTNIMVPTLFSELVYKIGMFYNEACVLVESNSVGGQVLNDLWDLEYENIMMTTEKKGDTVARDSGKSRMGLKQTKKTKSLGCAAIKALIESQQYIVQDFDTIQELTNFVRKANSFEADGSFNDDIVMTLVSFGWFTTQPYFSDWTDINTRSAIRSTILEQDDYEPFFFMDDGLD